MQEWYILGVGKGDKAMISVGMATISVEPLYEDTPESRIPL